MKCVKINERDLVIDLFAEHLLKKDYLSTIFVRTHSCYKNKNDRKNQFLIVKRLTVIVQILIGFRMNF